MEDESIEGLWVAENNTSYYKDFDWKKNSDFEDNVEMTDDNEDVLDINAFTKLLKFAQDSNNFESHKTSFLRDPHFSTRQKMRHR